MDGMKRFLNKLKKLSACSRQKEFIENASHEMQTPLAVLQSQLDLLLQDPDLTESQVAVIQSLYSVSSRLARLNRNLLLLAKLDHSQFKKTERIDFVQLLEKQLLYFRDLAGDSGIDVSVEINHPLTVKANKTLLESLTNNLVMNAIRHNVEHGTIHIQVSHHTFSISNTGEETPLNKNKLFKRFAHSPETSKGNGLGLSIVAQICTLHGWKITYQYRDKKHTFITRFC
jgi:signal transduction histidine kinase